MCHLLSPSHISFEKVQREFSVEELEADSDNKLLDPTQTSMNPKEVPTPCYSTLEIPPFGCKYTEEKTHLYFHHHP